MICPHCSKEFTNRSGYSNHVRRCPKNPNRIHEGLTNAGRERIRQSTISQNKTKWADPVIREKHRESMKRAVQNNPESYTSSNRGRTKQVIIDGIKFQGAWEVEFYQYCKASNIKIERPNKWFPYEWNGTRKYFPDFYLPEKELYVEVKGYETDRDRAKWSAFPKRLRVIKKEDIIAIRKQSFQGL